MTNDNVESVSAVSTTAPVETTNTAEKATPSVKANNNTVVVVSASIAKRPAAAEARKRRKEILSKQSKHQTKSINDLAVNVTDVIVDNNAVAEAANLAAVVAAAAVAAVDAVNLVSTEADDVAVATTAVPTLGNEHFHNDSNIENTTTVDIPFLDDANIAATAAAVAFNSSSTTPTETIGVPTTTNQGTIRRKNQKRSRELDNIVDENIQLNEDHDQDDEDEDDYDDDDINQHSGTSRRSSNKKTQIRYDPSTPMEKEQLAAWRREARRVRNRESAAASRQRIRGRIVELEEEIDDWKQKYDEAKTMIDQYQKLLQQQQQMQQVPTE
jgi:hypothetical protein